MLLKLFGMAATDYKRFHNFLMAHDCKVDYRSFRQGTPEPARPARVLLPPLPATPPAAAAAVPGRSDTPFEPKAVSARDAPSHVA